MEKNENLAKEPMFPAPFEYFEELIANDLQLHRELDQELEKLQQNYTKPKPYQLNYQMPGFSVTRQDKNFDGAMEQIENQKTDILAKIDKVIDAEIEKLEVETEKAQELRNIVYEQTHPNPFKDKSDLEKKEYIETSKSPKEAQRSFYYLLKEVESDKTIPKTKTKADRSPDKE